MKKIVLTGGGTLGHVTPHLALIPHLQEKGYEIHYVGTENGMEAPKMRSVPGVTYHAVKSGKLRRYFSWQNFTDPFRVIAGAFQSAHLMGKLKPDVVFSKGGFVAVPVVFGAWLHRIPVLCHESDLTPGLANKLCKPFARRFATTFPECAEALGPKAEMTGTPLRPELFTGSREKGLELLGFDGSRPVLLMMGGSSGAQSVNACLREALPALTAEFDMAHICGKGNLDPSAGRNARLPPDRVPGRGTAGRAGLRRSGALPRRGQRPVRIPGPGPAHAADSLSQGRQPGRPDSERPQPGKTGPLPRAAAGRHDAGNAWLKRSEQTWADREQLTRSAPERPPADGTDGCWSS